MRIILMLYLSTLTLAANSVSAQDVSAGSDLSTKPVDSAISSPVGVNESGTGFKNPLIPSLMSPPVTGDSPDMALTQATPDPIVAPPQRSYPTRLTSRLVKPTPTLLTTRLANPHGLKEPNIRPRGLRTTRQD